MLATHPLNGSPDLGLQLVDGQHRLQEVTLHRCNFLGFPCMHPITQGHEARLQQLCLTTSLSARIWIAEQHALQASCWLFHCWCCLSSRPPLWPSASTRPGAAACI